MPEFHLVQDASVGPTQCCFCSDFTGPFIDTCIEGDFGRLYVCAPNDHRSGCAGQIAAALGWISPEQMAQADAQVSEVIRELTEKLREAQQQQGDNQFARIEVGELEGFFNWKRAKDYRERKREKLQLEDVEA